MKPLVAPTHTPRRGARPAAGLFGEIIVDDAGKAARRAQVRAATKAWRERHPERAREVQSRYSASNPEQRRQTHRDSLKRSYGRDPQKIKAHVAAWKAKNPEKVRAHNLLNRAIAAGRIARGPCQDCGTTHRVQGHHFDYSRPLDVNWLCGPCHKKRHVQVKGGVA